MNLTALAAAHLSAMIEVLASPAVGGVIIALAGLMLVDLATAVGAAARNKDVEPLVLGEFLRTHVLGRWAPIVILIVLSTFSPALVPVVGLGVAAYTVETIASVRANIGLAKGE